MLLKNAKGRFDVVLGFVQTRKLVMTIINAMTTPGVRSESAPLEVTSVAHARVIAAVWSRSSVQTMRSVTNPHD